MKHFNQVSHIKNIIFLFVATSLIISPRIYSQAANEIVAKAGDVSVTKDEFKLRFELSPHPGKDNYDTSKVKRDFLNTLIAEKLLAQSAVKEGLDKSHEYQMAMNFKRNYYLRDALYKIEVKDKTVIPDSEYVKGKMKAGKSIKTKFIFSQNRNEIHKIYNDLKNGASFDSILSTRSENEEQKQTADITFGKMDPKIEDILFTLKPGEYTPPVELTEGWYICKVYSVDNKNILDESDFKKAERVVSERAENKTYEKFYKEFFKGVVVNAYRDVFILLSDAMVKYIVANKESFIKKHGKYTLYESEVNDIRKLISRNRLDLVFVKFNDYPVTLNEFLDYMSMEGFDFNNTETMYIKRRLNSYISTYIQNELLAREALKRGYDKLPDVAVNLKMWRDNYLSNLKMKEIYKGENVSDDEAYEFYSKNNRLIHKPDEVKIAEILTDDLDTVKKIFDGLDKGADFIELAKQYTLRDSMKSRGGIYDFQPVNKEGEIWKAASSMKIGDVYGPINLPEGFSIIKLLDKREGKREQIGSFEEAKNDIKNILRTEKMYSSLNDITAKLALDNNLEINEKVFNSIKVSYINMIVYRRFGFGGQQIAVPYSPDFSSWFKKYTELKKSITY